MGQRNTEVEEAEERVKDSSYLQKCANVFFSFE